MISFFLLSFSFFRKKKKNRVRDTDPGFGLGKGRQPSDWIRTPFRSRTGQSSVVHFVGDGGSGGRRNTGGGAPGVEWGGVSPDEVANSWGSDLELALRPVGGGVWDICEGAGGGGPEQTRPSRTE